MTLINLIREIALINYYDTNINYIKELFIKKLIKNS